MHTYQHYIMHISTLCAYKSYILPKTEPPPSTISTVIFSLSFAEEEGVESPIPAPPKPVPVVVYLDRANAQSFLATFAPHARLLPT